MQQIEFIVNQGPDYIQALAQSLQGAREFLKDNPDYHFHQLVVAPVFMATPKMMVDSPHTTQAARPGYTVTLVLVQSPVNMAAIQTLIEKTGKMQDAIIEDLTTGEITGERLTGPNFTECENQNHDWDIVNLSTIIWAALTEKDKQEINQGKRKKLICQRCGLIEYKA